MPRPVMRTLLPFLRCFTTRPMKSSRALVASFLVMPVFSASSAATLDSGTVGTDGLVAVGGVAIMRCPLDSSFRQRLPDAPGQALAQSRLSTNRWPARAEYTKNVDSWGFLGHLER